MKTPKFKRKKRINPIDKSIDSKLKNVGRYINIFTIIIGLLSLPFNKYADYFLVILFLIPIACIIITKIYNNIFDFGTTESGNAIFLYPLLISLIFSLIRCMAIHTLESRNILFATIIFTLLIVFLIVFKNDDFFKNGKLSWISIAIQCLFPLMFSYSLSVNLNYTLDFSEPQTYLSKVLLKSESHGKHVNYYFDIKTIDNQILYNDLRVNQNLFKITNKNDTVTLKIYKGLLNAPYYEVVKK
ncbi:MAG: hypothetical protein RLZZ175_1293 [Bacteroidota bacterium]|jgi:hypothetical protein